MTLKSHSECALCGKEPNRWFNNVQYCEPCQFVVIAQYFVDNGKEIHLVCVS